MRLVEMRAVSDQKIDFVLQLLEEELVVPCLLESVDDQESGEQAGDLHCFLERLAMPLWHCCVC